MLKDPSLNLSLPKTLQIMQKPMTKAPWLYQNARFFFKVLRSLIKNNNNQETLKKSKQWEIMFLRKAFSGLGLEGMLPLRFKVQHLLGANKSLGPHPLVKSQRFTLIRVGKLPRVRCKDPMGLVKVRVSWPGYSRLSKKRKSIFKSHTLRSHPSKLLASHSCQMHHIKQWGMHFQISLCWCCPKQANQLSLPPF